MTLCTPLVFAALLVIAAPELATAADSNAQAVDPATGVAAKQTSNLLTQPSERNQVIQSDPNAKKADAQVDALGGTQADKDEAYKIADQIFQRMVVESKGDPVLLQSLMSEAMKDPEKFGKTLKPEEIARIKALANQLPASQPKGAP